MSDRLNEKLLGHLLGALEDDEQEALDARLEQDERCCRMLVQWRRRLAALEMMRPDYEPPDGLAQRTCRYVASCMPVAAMRKQRGMTPAPPALNSPAGLRWFDAVAVALLLMTTAMLVFPAIEQSRFQARLASCQDGLRQLGLALSQYGQQQQTPLGQLAVAGRLTGAGALAVRHLRDQYGTERCRPLCSDAWLAVNGALVASPRSGLEPCALQQSPESTIPPCEGATDAPGTWRNGTDDGGRGASVPVPVPLLADAPSADLPGQLFDGHGGRGRNVWFDDGRASFVSAASPGRTDWILSRDVDSAALGISAPVLFVSGR